MIPIHAFTVPASHPALPGHFPGRPVVPGVVLLDHVAEALLAATGASRVATLAAVKFLRPVAPDETVDVFCDGGTGRVAFLCRAGGADVVRGTVVLA